MNKTAIGNALDMDFSSMKEEAHQLDGDVKRVSLIGDVTMVWQKGAKQKLLVFSDNGKALEDFEFDFRKGNLGIGTSPSHNQNFSISLGSLSIGGITQHIDVAGNVGQVAGRDIYNGTTSRKKKGNRTAFIQNFGGKVGMVMDMGETPGIIQKWAGATIGIVYVRTAAEAASVPERYAGAKIGKVVVLGENGDQPATATQVMGAMAGAEDAESTWETAVVVLVSPTAPDVEVKGSCGMYYLGLDQRQLGIYVHGDAAVTGVGGKLAKLDVTAYGSSDVCFDGVKTDNCIVVAYGSSDVLIHAVKSADITAYGDADVTVHGKPKSKRETVRGDADVTWE
jgi:hypothetical protein